MKVKIVYDNEAKPGFEKDWGFSSIVELADEKILFDTGWDGNILLSNMEKMDVQLEDIKQVVLSHEHWDHIGGMASIRRQDMEIYVLQSFSKRFKGELAARFDLREVKKAQEIRKGVWTTGELGKTIKEQSLIVEASKGLVIIVGCSHPGVGNILSTASQFGEIWGIIGGMHDFKDYELLEGLGLIAPSHCTVNKKKIAELFPEAYIEAKAGLEISL